MTDPCFESLWDPKLVCRPSATSSVIDFGIVDKDTMFSVEEGLKD